MGIIIIVTRMSNSCNRKNPCSKCIEKAKTYFNLRFVEIDCCHYSPMKLTLASQDANDKILWQVYQDLSKKEVLEDVFVSDGSIIGDEISEKIQDINDAIYFANQKEAWSNNMVKLIASTRRKKLELPEFNISKANLDIIKDNLEYFGFNSWDDLDYCAKYFLYDILLRISPKYTMLEKYKDSFEKIFTLQKNGKYPENIDKPDKLILKFIFNEIVKDLVRYFTK